ncbi:MAG: CTP synthase, partial [Acholeplasmataceae bacterium]|nr:CTP synthase [Acholeplasmataceae bacterium]
LRSEVPVSSDIKEKIALFCDVKKDLVFESVDVDIIYKMILNLKKQQIDDKILAHFNLDAKQESNLIPWENLISKISKLEQSVTIGLVGKYVSLHDAYLSVSESLNHAGYHLDRHIKLVWLNSEKITEENVAFTLKNLDGILVPGGFGKRGTDGKILAIQYARENNLPFLGICLGLQLTAIEFARNVLGIKDATSSEFHPHSKYAVIDLMKDMDLNKLGGTQRLGANPFKIKKGTLAYKVYNATEVSERHRHRYEFNKMYQSQFEQAGMVFSGINTDYEGIEIIEYPKNDFFVAAQFHPEFKSRPLRPHPLFCGFVKACKTFKDSKM